MQDDAIPKGWPDRFTDNEYVSFDPPMSIEAARWWNDRFLETAGLFPEQFVDAIADGAPGEIRGTISNLDHEAETFEIEISGIAPDTTRLFLKSKRFEVTEGSARDGETQVSPDLQGKGIGTGLMINLIELGRRIGLESIDIEAEDIGRYAWLSMGFLPDETSWRFWIVPAARQKIALCLAQGEIDEETHSAVAAVLAQKDRRAARDLLVFTQSVSGPGPQGTNTSVSLCKAIMLHQGTSWLGAFSFRDTQGLELFDTYKEALDVDHPRPW